MVRQFILSTQEKFPVGTPKMKDVEEKDDSSEQDEFRGFLDLMEKNATLITSSFPGKT